MRPGTNASNISSRAEGLRTRRSAGALDAKDGKPAASLRSQMPQVWKLLGPRKNLLMLGFGLMIINRLSGLVLPVSTRYFVDGILDKGQGGKLLPLIGLVLSATLIQALTSFGSDAVSISSRAEADR